MTPDGQHPALGDVAVVIIGRNEGERLVRCLNSVRVVRVPVVYVDSGSTDGSIEAARALGAEVVQLDLTIPFTAARARNTGLHRVMDLWPQVRFVQFIDGDCELHREWLLEARASFTSRSDVAVVFGRRRERFPDRSVYNRLCDLEWKVPPGEVRSCGGDAMMRTSAFLAVGGYREDLVAGEEPELCVRFRGAGWKVLSTGTPMTTHDAAMTTFSQWWRRSVRCGWAFAAGSHLHGRPPERHFVREVRRAWFWAGAIPLLAIFTSFVAGPVGLLIVFAYPVQILRLYMTRRRGHPWAAGEALFMVAGKFPELVGQFRFYRELVFGGERRLIEYK